MTQPTAACQDTAKPSAPSSPAWRAAAGCVPGRAHLRSGIPCQDAAAAGAIPRPYLIVCDGRGSARHSDVGARSAIRALEAQLENGAALLQCCLDSADEMAAQSFLPALTQLLCRTATAELRRQATAASSEPREFEHTLLLVALGDQRLLHMHIGDGGIVIERQGHTSLLSAPERGEFANVTHFVTASGPLRVRKGLVPVAGVTGVAAFTDGTAEKMLRHPDGQPSEGFAHLWDALRRGQDETGITEFLADPRWERQPIVHDDRAIALLAHAETVVAQDLPDAATVRDAESAEQADTAAALIPDPTPDRLTEVGHTPTSTEFQGELAAVQVRAKRHRPALSRVVGGLVGIVALGLCLMTGAMAWQILETLDVVTVSPAPVPRRLARTRQAERQREGNGIAAGERFADIEPSGTEGPVVGLDELEVGE